MKSQTRTTRFTFAARRKRNASLLLVVIVLLGITVYAQNQSLQHSSFATGCILFGCLVFLALFSLRKKLTFLPAVGSASMWMQLHIYVGFSTLAIFGFHIGWRIPNGIFEGMLAILYLTVALSGVYGLYVTRLMPRRLTALREEIIYERIPALRVNIACQTRDLVLQACESTDVLAKLYVNRLAVFFEQPRGLAYLVSPSGRKRRQLISEIQDLDRYLADDQRQVSQQLKQMVQEKDDLDYHRAIQGRLKLWLFVHIGMTYSLLIVALLHGIMAQAFAGGLR